MSKFPLQNTPRESAPMGLFGGKAPHRMWIMFVLVGFVTVTSYLSALAFLHEVVHVGVYASSAIGFMIAVTISFTLNRRLTFGRGADIPMFARYFTVLVCAMMLNHAIMYSLVDILQVHYVLAQLLSIAVITPINFVFNYIWVFRMERATS